MTTLSTFCRRQPYKIIDKNFASVWRSYTARGAQVSASLLQSYCCLAVMHQAAISYQDMFSRIACSGFMITSCQQAWRKLIVKTSYPQPWCKLFQQFTASLQISCKLGHVWFLQTWCNLMKPTEKLASSLWRSGCVLHILRCKLH